MMWLKAYPMAMARNMAKYLMAALLLVPATAHAQNSTFGTITAASTSCTATSCVYFQVPPNFPWVSLSVAGTWTGTLQVTTVSDPYATYQTLNTSSQTLISTVTANGNEAIAVGSALFILVRASSLSSGQVQIGLTASQSGTPLSNPVFSGGMKAVGLTAPNGGSSSTCFASDGSIQPCSGGGLPAGVTSPGTGSLTGTGTFTAPTISTNAVIANGSAGAFGQSPQSDGGGQVRYSTAVGQFTLPGLNPFGDSITRCIGVGAGAANSATCYTTFLQNAFGGGLNNWALSGSYAADMAAQIFFTLNPSQNGNIRNSVLCCTNDAINDFNTSGATTTGRQANAAATLLAGAAWATIPLEAKLDGANYIADGCTTTGTVAVGTYGPNLTTIQLESVGASLTCPTMVSGSQAQYYSYLATYNGTSAASFSLDSGAVTDTWNGFGYNGQTVGTTNNPTLAAPLAIRYGSPNQTLSSGAHTFTVTCTANCATPGGVIGGIYLGGASASGTPGATCIFTFANGGTATVPIAPNGTIIQPRIALTITSAGSATNTPPTTATISNGTAVNCAGTPSIATWTSGAFTLLFEGSVPQNPGSNLGSLTQNPPNLYMGGTIRFQQSASFTGGTGAQGNSYTDAYDNIVKTAANTTLGDGAMTPFVPVRTCEGTDYATLDSDMQAANLPNGQATIASTNAGLHPNGSIDALTGLPVGGHPHIANCFLKAMQPTVAQIATNKTVRTSGSSTSLACSDGSLVTTAIVTVTIPDPSTCTSGQIFNICSNTGNTTIAVTGTNQNVTSNIPLKSCITVLDQNQNSWFQIASAPPISSVIRILSASATLANTDGTIYDSCSACTITLPTPSAGSFPIGTIYKLNNYGTTAITISGATKNVPTSLPPGASIEIQAEGSTFWFMNASTGLGSGYYSWSKVSRVSTGTFTASSLLTTSVSALYRLNASIACDTTVAAATVTLSMSYTDTSNTVQTVSGGTATCTTLGSSSIASINGVVVNAKTGTNITITTTTANSPTYDVSATVDQLTIN